MCRNLIVIIVFIVFITLFPAFIYSEERSYKSYTDIGYIEESNTNIKEVLDSPGKFHRDILILDGEITEIDYRRIFTGRKFTVLKITDGINNIINVYARGYIQNIGKGTKIRVNGRYSKEKSFLFKTYRNVMKARKVYILES